MLQNLPFAQRMAKNWRRFGGYIVLSNVWLLGSLNTAPMLWRVFEH